MTMLSTAERARMYEKLVARGHACEARDKKHDLQVALDDAVRALRALAEAGVCHAFVNETARGLSDHVANTDAAYLRTIDEAGEWAAGVDFTDIEQLIADAQPGAVGGGKR